MKCPPSSRLKHTHLSTTDLSVWVKSHLRASSKRSQSICSKFSFESDMMQKVSVHTKLHIWCSASPSRSERIPLLFLIHASSTLANIWVAIFRHKRGASTLPSGKCQVKPQQLSTHSDVALQPRRLTQKGYNQSSVCVVGVQNVGHMLRLASSKAVLMSKLARFLSDVPLHTGILLVTPNVFAAISKSTLARVGSVFHPLHQHADSFTFQAPFPSKRRIVQDAYHFDITNVSAAAL